MTWIAEFPGNFVWSNAALVTRVYVVMEQSRASM
jgi:hypothetical protein